jgi:hypothetical protein
MQRAGTLVGQELVLEDIECGTPGGEIGFERAAVLDTAALACLPFEPG